MEFKPELLSPAGSLKVLKAAANTGADAVYFGLSSFNARYGAKNFTTEEAKEGIAYLKNRGKKSYITLNTLLKDTEIKPFINEVRNVDPEKWNNLAEKTIAAIRKTNKERKIIIGSTLSVFHLAQTELIITMKKCSVI